MTVRVRVSFVIRGANACSRVTPVMLNAAALYASYQVSPHKGWAGIM